MMWRSPLFLVVVACVVACARFIAAEATVQTHGHPSALDVSQRRNLKTTEEKSTYPVNDEERAIIAGAVARIKGLLSRNPMTKSDAKNNMQGASEAYKKVNSIIGSGKTRTELTPAKAQELEKYARSNSDKWWAMAYYTTNVLGIGLTVFFVYGVLFLGWIPYGMGGSPRPNN